MSKSQDGPRKKEKTRTHFIAGMLARFEKPNIGDDFRVTGAVIMCPADTVKTRMQFQGIDPSVRQYR